MTSKERVLRCIKGEAVDKVPVHHIQFSSRVASAILGREALVGGAFVQWREMQALWEGEQAHAEFCQRCREDALAIARACGHDILRLSYWRWPKTKKPVQKLDDYTFLFVEPNGHTYTMTYCPDLELFVREDRWAGEQPPADSADEITEAELLDRVLGEEERTRNYQPRAEASESLVKQYAAYPEYLLKLGGGTVTIPMDSTRELLAVAQWPKLYARLLMAQAQRLAMDVPGMAAAGMQVNFAGSDFCTNSGPIVSPATWREVVVPALKVLVDACHRHGIKYFYSSDGNFWPVAESMFTEAGVDGWFEVDGSAGMDLRRLRRAFPEATFIGNIRSQVLHTGTPAEVEREVMSCLEAAHEMGGIVVGVSNMIMPDTPPQNVEIMLGLIERNR